MERCCDCDLREHPNILPELVSSSRGSGPDCSIATVKNLFLLLEKGGYGSGLDRLLEPSMSARRHHDQPA